MSARIKDEDENEDEEDWLLLLVLLKQLVWPPIYSV